MKVLFVGTNDSSNYVLVNVIKEFKKRGHDITIVCGFEDTTNSKMFNDNNMDFLYIKEFDFSTIDKYNIAILGQSICSEEIYKFVYNIYKSNLFIITFSTLFLFNDVFPYSDLVLCMGDARNDEIKNSKLRYNLLSIGNPQYDDIIKTSNTCDKKTNKKILFIEQGAYPVGEIGKNELAKFLIEIAKNNPNYEITVKPRYLLNELENRSHKTLNHLYDYLDNIPSNLILLREFINLEELINDCDNIITCWSTAYIEGALANKNLLLIKGLPSIDVYDIRTCRIENAYKKLQDTGCVENYSVFFNKKISFNRVRKEYLNHEIFDYLNSAAIKVVLLCEFINEEYFSKSKRLKDLVSYNYYDFLKYSKQHQQIDYYDQQFLKNKDICGYINQHIQNLVNLNEKIKYKISNDKINYIWNFITIEESPYTKINNYVSDLIYETLYNLFCEHKDKIAEDFFYLYAYNQSKFDYINSNKETVLSKAGYLYYKGLILYRNNEFEKALLYFYNYLDNTKGKKFYETLTESDEYINLVNIYIIVCNVMIKDNYDIDIHNIPFNRRIILLNELYSFKRYEIIFNMLDEQMDYNLLLFKALSYYDLNDKENAIPYFERFLNKSNKNINYTNYINKIGKVKYVVCKLLFDDINRQDYEELTNEMKLLLLNELFVNKYYDLILGIDNNIFSDAIILFYKGKVMYLLGNYQESILNLQEFVKKLNTMEISNNDIVISAHFYIALGFYKTSEFEKSLNYFYKCDTLSNNSHIKAKEYINSILKILTK